MKNSPFSLIVFFLITLGLHSAMAQEQPWFYMRAKDTLFNPVFEKKNDQLIYSGNDKILKAILEKYKIYTFKKTFRKAKKENLKKTFFVIADKKELLQDLLKNASYIFEFGEEIPSKDKKIFEPNDYGLTSTIGADTGLKINLDYLDFLEAPEAWYYTTGSRDVVIGISDGIIDTTNVDFKGKSKIIRPSSVANGHGYSISANAVAQGNNGYGIPGICYDCSVYGTSYGYFQKLEPLLELSKMGVKVINCSWIGTSYYQTAQDVINEMFENGTIIVAAAGNKDWIVGKHGKLTYYPAAYDHVISVSSGMYRNENVEDNILVEDNGNYYAKNIRGYVGRTMGFKDNDTLKAPRIHDVSVAILNPQVDILAPTVGLFRFSQFILKNELLYSGSETTSGATPLVSGTIGLMLSLYPCLPIDEVETILKFTSLNIDHIEANQRFKDNYGAGMLKTGSAVKMVYNMFSEKETVFIENHHFSRWDFKLTTISKSVRFQNQSFTEDATLKLKTKNQIVLGKNTILKPNENGSIHLSIDPSLKKECELRLRDPSIEN